MWLTWENLRLKEYAHELMVINSESVYEGLGIVFCFGAVFFLIWKGVRKGLQYTALLALLEYITMIYCSTVFCRTVIDDEKYDRTQLTPFWSYNRPELFVENVINVVMFVPIGFMLGCTCRNIKWWQALLIGVGISVSIEVLQFVTGKGFSEFDDVMHNTLGCMIGFGLYLGLTFLIKRVSTRRGES